MRSNWLKDILIKNSKVLLEHKKKFFNVNRFYFEKPIGRIDTIGLLPNTNGSVTPVLWEVLTVDEILGINKSLKGNKFYYIKEIQGKNCKVKPLPKSKLKQNANKKVKE